MPVDLVLLNQVLDAAIKLIFLVLFVYLVLVLRHLDQAIQSVEESAESIERTSERLGKLFILARYLPFVGGKRR